MGCKGRVFWVLSVCFLLFSIYLSNQVYAEVLGPGWHLRIAEPVSPEEARAYYNSMQRSSGVISSASSATTIFLTAEIQMLAYALQYDPKLIYDYVHNHIDYVPYYGSLKGATLTYLDGCGNDFDQASLMVALLRESSNYNWEIGAVQYVYGTMTIPGNDIINWFGIDNDGRISTSVLGNGGIPGTTYVYDYINYNISYVEMDRG